MMLASKFVYGSKQEKVVTLQSTDVVYNDGWILSNLPTSLVEDGPVWKSEVILKEIPENQDFIFHFILEDNQRYSSINIYADTDFVGTGITVGAGGKYRNLSWQLDENSDTGDLQQIVYGVANETSQHFEYATQTYLSTVFPYKQRLYVERKNGVIYHGFIGELTNTGEKFEVDFFSTEPQTSDTRVPINYTGSLYIGTSEEDSIGSIASNYVTSLGGVPSAPSKRTDLTLIYK